MFLSRTLVNGRWNTFLKHCKPARLNSVAVCASNLRCHHQKACLKHCVSSPNLLNASKVVTTFEFCRSFSSLPAHNVIKLPNLSPTMTTGSVVNWAKKEGDRVDEGDLLAEIETDKATMSLDASDGGYVAKILVPAGTRDIPVGTALCVIIENQGDIGAFKDFVPAASTSTAGPPPPKAADSPPAAAPPSRAAPPSPAPVSAPPKSDAPSGQKIMATPKAKALASQLGVDLKLLAGRGTGPDGSIVAEDVQKFKDSGAAPVTPSVQVVGPAPVQHEDYTDIPVSNMRAVIAKRLLESRQTVPDFSLCVDIEMDAVIKMRSEINSHLASKVKDPKAAPKVSVNDILVKAIALACKAVPECNSSWHGTFIRQYNSVDVSVAVATPNGLITPIVFGADTKGLSRISSDITALAAKAKENKLQPHEFMGGTFTISNLGMFSIKAFTAIINPPQSCILAVGSTQKHVVPCAKSEKGWKEVSIMTVTLCCDHRVVDGAIGAKWLAEFKQLLEKPLNMLL